MGCIMRIRFHRPIGRHVGDGKTLIITAIAMHHGPVFHPRIAHGAPASPLQWENVLNKKAQRRPVIGPIAHR